jgi:peptidoglycan/LPS O-acetylase OafA/YrhL
MKNNFDLIRLVAASLVIFGHSFYFLGLTEPIFFSWLPPGPIGVHIFFIISGYLVAQSWSRDPNALRFLARRALRIFPGLAVCVLVSVFLIGPIFTTLTVKQYFKDHATFHYLRDIALYIQYYLPGVFTTSRLPNAVDGSLWSLPVEFFMYFLLLFVNIIVRKKKWPFLIISLVSAMVCLYWAQNAKPVVFYATDMRYVFISGTFFWMGTLVHKYNLEKHLTPGRSVAAIVAMLCLSPWPAAIGAAAWVLLPVIVLGFGLSYDPFLNKLTQFGDLSYGAYIYAFPIQQILACASPNVDIISFLMLCFPITLVVAFLSWRFVEKPMLLLKPRRPPS